MSRVYEALKKAEQERATGLFPEPAFPFAAEATQIVDRTVMQSREPTQGVPPDVLIPKHPAAAVTPESAGVGHQRLRNLLVRGLTGSIVVVAMVASVILLGPRRTRITEFVGDPKRPAARGAWIPHPEVSAGAATPKLIAVPQQPQPRFAVQIGAFPDRARAEGLASQFSNLYQQTILVAPIEVRGKTLYRVRFLVGTKAGAEALANSMLREQRLKAWIAALPWKAGTLPRKDSWRRLAYDLLSAVYHTGRFHHHGLGELLRSCAENYELTTVCSKLWAQVGHVSRTTVKGGGFLLRVRHMRRNLSEQLGQLATAKAMATGARLG